MNDSNDLYALLSEPVIPEDEPRSPRPWIVAAGAVAVIVLIVVVWASGGDTESVAATSTPVPGETGAPDASADESTTTTLPVFQWPDLRFDAAMVFDPGADRIVLIGGQGSIRSRPVLDAWVLAPDMTWAPLEATLEPPARVQLGAAYAPVIESVVVIGGAPDPTQACGLFSFVPEPLPDVWALDTSAGAWDRLSASGGPEARWGHRVAYVPALEKVLLFGGVGTTRSGSFTELLDDAWLFDPVENTWEQLDVDGPPARACHGMTHDPATGLVYLWGGQVAQSRGDTTLWTFDPEALQWTAIETGEGPDQRWIHQLVFEPTTGLIYSIGGWGRHVETSDTGTITSLQAIDEVWAFDPSTAIWVEKAPLPAALHGHAAAPDGHGNIVVYSGLATLVYDTAADSWTDVTPWELLEP